MKLPKKIRIEIEEITDEKKYYFAKMLDFGYFTEADTLGECMKMVDDLVVSVFDLEKKRPAYYIMNKTLLDKIFNKLFENKIRYRFIKVI